MTLRKKAASSGWLNPFPTKGLSGVDPDLTNREFYDEQKKLRDLMQSAAKVGLGWAGVLFASRLALHGVDKLKGGDRVDTLKSHVNAKYPRIALNPDTNDTAQEEMLRGEGVPAFDRIPELLKSAKDEDNGLQKTPFAPVVDPIKKLYESFTRKDVSPLHIAAALSAAIGGGYMGWQTADKIVDRMRTKELDGRIATDRNELNKLMYDEYMRTRGMAKTSAEKEEPDTSVWHGLKSLYPVYFAAALALAYTTSKNYADNNDPNRQKIKQLKRFAKERAKMTDAPVLLNDTDFGAGDGLSAKKARIGSSIALPSGRKPIDI